MNSKKLFESCFSEDQKNAVWKKATIVTRENPNEFRKDRCGAWIKFSEYGNRDSQYGWEIDHIKPVSLEGSDDLYNLQPLQWKNNLAKGDEYPATNYCVIRAKE